MGQAVLVEVIFGASLLLVVVFGAMVAVSVLGAIGWLRVPRRTSNILFVASMVSLVAGVLLMLSTALIPAG
jgi:uncharacterized membrane protein YdcZ (DUF606 family)